MSKAPALSPEQQRLATLLTLPENRLCVDCCAPAPKWASLNLGVFFCMECSGLHRMIGVHVTKVKSTTLDKWEGQWVDHMARIGNVRGNAVWEARLTDRSKKPRPTSSMDERERFIRDKYERGLYRGAPTRESLLRAANEVDMPLDRLVGGAPYMEGVDIGEVDVPVGATAAVGKAVNPAVLRRQQKKAAEEAAEKAKVDAEAARVAAVEAEADARARAEAADAMARSEAARQESMMAGLGQVLGGAPAPAPGATGFSFFTPAAPAPTTAFTPAPTAFTPASPVPTAFTPAVAAPAPAQASSFSFIGGAAPNPTAPEPDLFGAMSSPAPAPAAPSSTGFSFLSSSGPAAAPPAISAPAASPSPSASGFAFVAAALSPIVNGAASPFVPASSGTPVPMVHSKSAPQLLPVAQPAASSPAFVPQPVELPTIPASVIDLGTAAPPPSVYTKLFDIGALPTSVDSVLARQQTLGAIHSKANRELMADFLARQTGLNTAYQQAMDALSRHLTTLNGSAPATASGSSTSARSAPSSSAALEAALTSLEVGVAAIDLNLKPSGGTALNGSRVAAPAPAPTNMDMFGGLSMPSAPAPAPAASGFNFLASSSPAPTPAPTAVNALASLLPPSTSDAPAPALGIRAPTSSLFGLESTPNVAAPPLPSSQPPSASFMFGSPAAFAPAPAPTPAPAPAPAAAPDLFASLQASPPQTSTPPPAAFQVLAPPSATQASTATFSLLNMPAPSPAVASPMPDVNSVPTAPPVFKPSAPTQAPAPAFVPAAAPRPAAPAFVAADEDAAVAPPPAPAEEDDVAEANARAAAALFS